MKLEKISIEFSQKINLPDYQGAEAKVWICAEAEDGDNIEEISTELFAKAKDAVYSQLTEIADAHGKEIPSIKKFFMGNEVEQPQPKYNRLDLTLNKRQQLQPVSRITGRSSLGESLEGEQDDTNALLTVVNGRIENYDDVPF